MTAFPPTAWPLRTEPPVSINALVYLEGAGNYTILRFADGTKAIYSKTLKRFEECLPVEEFVRINKTYLIRRNYIRTHLSKSEILLQNGLRLKVARRRRAKV